MNIIQHREELNTVYELLNTQQICVMDTETTGLNAYLGAKPFLLQIMFPNASSAYAQNMPFLIYLNESNGAPYTLDSSDKINLANAFKTFFSKEQNTAIGHNIKFDLHQIDVELGLFTHSSASCACNIYDTMVIGKVLQNDLQSVSMENMAIAYKIDAKKSDVVSEYLAANKKTCYVDGNPRYDRVPFSIMAEYAAQDVLTTWELYKYQKNRMYAITEPGEDQIADRKKLFDVLKTEVETTKVMFFMEKRGIKVDLDYANMYKAHVSQELHSNLFQYYALTGQEFVNSPKAIGDMLTSKFGVTLPKGKETKTGLQNWLVNETVLMQRSHPVCKLILEIRKYSKLESTYIDGILKFSDKNNVVHPSFRQCGADTLRSSSSEPNAQNIPTDEIDGFNARKIIVPHRGWLYSVDFSAQEVVMAASVCQEKILIDAIQNNRKDPNKYPDVHTLNARVMGTERKYAKGVFFALLYGSGAGVIASQLGVDQVQAAALKQKLLGTLTNVKKKMYSLQNYVNNEGYILTAYGNPLWINHEFSYKALNYAIQGASAIQTKKALVAWDKLANKYGDGYPLLVIHDEIIAEFENVVDEETKKDFLSCFRNALIPLENACLPDAEFSEPMGRWKK